MKKINIEDIDFSLNYEGYLWFSNQTKPEIRNSIQKEDFKQLPFIVEGNLYAKEQKISISIQYRDGAYFIYSVCLKDLPEEQITKHQYITHDIEVAKAIEIIQFWEDEQQSEILEGMTMLVPKWRAFAGFINTKN